MSPWFPVALVLDNRSCLVVGDSEEAALRAGDLWRAGARVTVVSARPCDALRQVIDSRALQHEQRAFIAADLEGQWLAVLADRDPETLARMAPLANARRLFFCAIDQPEQNSFAHMAQARAGLVNVAITTQGQAPALGRRLREELQRLFDESGLAAFADKLAELRRTTPNEARRAVLGDAVRSLEFRGELALGARKEPLPTQSR